MYRNLALRVARRVQPQHYIQTRTLIPTGVPVHHPDSNAPASAKNLPPYTEKVIINAADIEKNWVHYPDNKKRAVIDHLAVKQKGNWGEMSLEDKKAAYWVAFGEFGPRAANPPGFQWRVFGGTALVCAAGVALFAGIRMFADPAPISMTREWQEKTNEIQRAQNSDPITGISSANYKGAGHVQSK